MWIMSAYLPIPLIVSNLFSGFYLSIVLLIMSHALPYWSICFIALLIFFTQYSCTLFALVFPPGFISFHKCIPALIFIFACSLFTAIPHLLYFWSWLRLNLRWFMLVLFSFNSRATWCYLLRSNSWLNCSCVLPNLALSPPFIWCMVFHSLFSFLPLLG